MARLLVLACSATKRSDPDPIPALARYDGPLWRTLRAADPEGRTAKVAFLSAHYGFRDAAAPIADYDARLTQDLAERMIAGGVTTLQVLPGSGNLIGGRGVTLKVVPARSVQGMKFPGAKYGLKMACGENPKRVYGSKGRMPSTRMGNFAVDRATWAKAAAYKKKLDEGKPVDRDLAMETLAGVLSAPSASHGAGFGAAAPCSPTSASTPAVAGPRSPSRASSARPDP